MRRRLEQILAWLLKDESGQGLIEYGLIAVLISVVAIGVMQIVGGEIQNIFSTIGDAVTNASA